MSEKKISFGFKQVKKQPLCLPLKVKGNTNKYNGIELIQCLEGQTIKVLHEKEKEKPLIIPLLNAQKTSTALASLKNLKSVLDGENTNDDEQKIDEAKTTASSIVGKVESQTIEQRVVAELLAEAKSSDENVEESNGGTIAVPLNTHKLPLNGAVESSLDDYDRIPITQFGLGMLRGMGLKDEEIISKQNKEPELRPKGMGLGADKAIKKKKLLVEPAANESLEIKKNAYIRILAGKYRDLYGQIEGLDDQSCRVIVKLALGGKKETLNEFMVQPVSKQEYLQYGKVINSAKYEEYRRKQSFKVEKNKDPEKTRSSRDDIRSRDKAVSVSSQNSNRQPSGERFKHSDKQEKYQFGERNEGSSSQHRRSRSKEYDSRTMSKYGEKADDRRRRPSYERDERREKYSSNHKRDKERRRSSSSSSDSSDSEHKKRHRQKSSKKHKKKFSHSKHHESDGDDDRERSKKKSQKRERSRSRGRR